MQLMMSNDRVCSISGHCESSVSQINLFIQHFIMRGWHLHVHTCIYYSYNSNSTVLLDRLNDYALTRKPMLVSYATFLSVFMIRLFANCKIKMKQKHTKYTFVLILLQLLFSVIHIYNQVTSETFFCS